ncbi:hypothetical protein ACJ6WF_43765 [Streptomyces sp. MMS24-I2-30]
MMIRKLNRTYPQPSIAAASSVSTHEAAAVGAASTLLHAAFTPRLRKDP